jgi:hypothetical protein
MRSIDSQRPGEMQRARSYALPSCSDARSVIAYRTTIRSQFNGRQWLNLRCFSPLDYSAGGKGVNFCDGDCTQLASSRRSRCGFSVGNALGGVPGSAKRPLRRFLPNGTEIATATRSLQSMR